MIKKNDEIQLTITGIGSTGEGVGKIDGFAVFVPYAIMGEEITVRMEKVNKSYGFGKIVSIEKPSPNRIEPTCPYFYQCGGCSYQHIKYEEELKNKTLRVKDALERLGGFSIKVDDCVPSPLEFAYRNKAQFPVNQDGIGFYAPRSHRVIPMDCCPIQHPINEKIVKAIKDLNYTPYNEKSHTGSIRHIFTRVAVNNGEIMVCIVTREKKLKLQEDLINALKPLGVTSILHNINNQRTNVIMGEETHLIWGKDVLVDYIGEKQFNVSLKSFYQVNNMQTKNVYDYIKELCDLKGDEIVADLYCGIGTIGQYVADKAQKIIGVDIVPESIENARTNAEINGLTNAEYFVNKAENKLEILENSDIVILDPPRRGCDSSLLTAIGESKPQKIVYMSCNPSTLARDLTVLANYGYTANKAVPFDMFPKTPHVECVVLIEHIGE